MQHRFTVHFETLSTCSPRGGRPVCWAADTPDAQSRTQAFCIITDIVKIFSKSINLRLQFVQFSRFFLRQQNSPRFWPFLKKSTWRYSKMEVLVSYFEDFFSSLAPSELFFSTSLRIDNVHIYQWFDYDLIYRGGDTFCVDTKQKN